MSQRLTAQVYVQTAFLGDLILSLPTLKRMRNLWPNDKIILVCRKGIGDLFLKLQLADEVLEVKKGHRGSYQVALQKLEKFNVEKVIAPHASIRTTLFCMQIKAQFRVGLQNWLNLFLFNKTKILHLSSYLNIRI